MKVNFSKSLKIDAQHREINYESRDPDGVKQEIMDKECVSGLGIFFRLQDELQGTHQTLNFLHIIFMVIQLMTFNFVDMFCCITFLIFSCFSHHLLCDPVRGSPLLAINK